MITIICYYVTTEEIILFFIRQLKEGSVYGELEECLINRGQIYGIDRTEDGCAIEIWLMIDNEPYCYYFFPYGTAVVEY